VFFVLTEIRDKSLTGLTKLKKSQVRLLHFESAVLCCIFVAFFVAPVGMQGWKKLEFPAK